MEKPEVGIKQLECLCDELTSHYYLAVCNNAEAAEKIRVLAEETSVNNIAIGFYALILCRGNGLFKDLVKASRLAAEILQSLEALAESSSTEIAHQCTNYLLAMFHLHKIVGPKSDDLVSLYHLRRSVNSHYAPALNDFALMYYQEMFSTAPRLSSKDLFGMVKLAADLLYPPAFLTLGIFYEYGVYYARDTQKAFKHYKTAVNYSLVEAEVLLARCYYHGDGIKQDVQTALTWWRKAANRNCLQAQYNLGEYHFRDDKSCFTDDELNLRDQEEGLKWYNMAAEQNHCPSLNALGYLYLEGRNTATPKDEVRALEFFRRSAVEGCLTRDQDYMSEEVFQVACAHNHRFLMQYGLTAVQQNRVELSCLTKPEQKYNCLMLMAEMGMSMVLDIATNFLSVDIVDELDVFIID